MMAFSASQSSGSSPSGKSICQLDAFELASERLFTHPSHVFYDGRLMRHMLGQLKHAFANELALQQSRKPLAIQLHEADGRTHRSIFTRPQELRKSESLVVVGFFGQRRPDADPIPIQEVDDLLLEELYEHPGLLSYSTLELTCGNFANCVVFLNEEAKNHWASSRTHAYSVEQLAPDYYFNVRLYNGVLSNGIANCNELMLSVVKYYDFSERPYWQAWRPLLSDHTRAPQVASSA